MNKQGLIAHASRIAAWVAPPFVFLVVMTLFYPFRYPFEFDPDEGIEAIKGMMVLRGYRLYYQIWNDQAPLLTMILSLWFRLFGLRIVAGRLLVLLFSAGLISMAVHFLRRSWGPVAATFAPLALILMPAFARLSVSLMTGLPSIALAFLSFIAIAAWHDRRSLGWLSLSGLALGLSILTKAFTAFLVPLWLTGVFLASHRSRRFGTGRFETWIPAAVLVGALAVTMVVGLLTLVGSENLDLLVRPHLTGRRVQDALPLPPVGFYLRKSASLLLLAGIGTARAVRKRSWPAVYLAAWGVSAVAVLAVNKPMWYHQQLLITIPAALLAAIAVQTAWSDLQAMFRARKGAAPGIASCGGALVLVALFLAARIPQTAPEFDAGFPNLTDSEGHDLQRRELLAVVWDHAPQTTWFYTDRPMFAFLTGLPVPPNLAVISRKRLVGSELTDAEILATLEQYKPELILNSRFGLAVVEEYARRWNYTQVAAQLYFRSQEP